MQQTGSTTITYNLLNIIVPLILLMPVIQPYLLVTLEQTIRVSIVQVQVDCIILIIFRI